jgi:hypothetical protein
LGVVVVVAAAVVVVNGCVLAVIAEQSDDAVATVVGRRSLESMVHSFELYNYVIAVMASRLTVAAVALLMEVDHGHE